MSNPALPDLSMEWAALDAVWERLSPRHLRDLFAEDANRFETFSVEASGLLMDFSKEKLDAEARAALMALARKADVEGARQAMVSGEKINRTEGRAVLHMALRDGAGDQVMLDGEDVMPEVRAVRARMLAFAEDVRNGRARAADGQPFTDVINIGIGGSDLGPAMAAKALSPWHEGPRVHFVSNVDGAHLGDTLAGLDPARTLIVVASKTFTTLETMMNARAAKAWLEAAMGARAGQHMAAVSTNLEATATFGIDESRVFGFWDWVGGRFSVWSSVGLPLAIAIGANGFREFLRGAGEMDRHFRDAPLEANLPVLLALIGIWRRNAMGARAYAVIPYAERLSRFPAFLQQLEMESTGKSVRHDGTPVQQATSPVLFGEPGTNAQHSFFQMLHQGAEPVPVDFLMFSDGVASDKDQQTALLACGLAQSAALAFGDPMAKAPHKRFAGDRPSTVLLAENLNPGTLGALIALYEHKIFVQAVIWGINPFDQFGVELGKRLAGDLMPALDGQATELDGSTAGLIHAIRTQRGS